MMHCRPLTRCLLAAAAVVFSTASLTTAADNPRLGPGVPAFTVRPGYRVTLAADHLKNARFIEFDDTGTLYLSEPGPGKIIALRDQNGDGVYESQSDFVTGQRTVHGMQWFNGLLWFTTSDAIHTARDTNHDGKADEVKTLLADLPHGGHWWRTILVDADGFYTSIGDSGNITDQTDTDRQKIWHYKLDGSGKTLFVSGIRNTEKLLYRPGTREVWGCDHGSDNFGEKFGEKPGRNQPITNLNPPDEFNHYVQGGFYGHPFITGLKMPRPEYAGRKDILELADKTIPPAWCFPAHWAPNGWTFLTKDYFPGHQGDAIITFHGSWNRLPKAGYAVMRVLFDPVTHKPYGSQVLVSTLGPDGQTLERPVDAAEAPDGSVLFTGDQGNRIYRLTKTNESPTGN
jgi:glucose/arabinose dehydrogenase